MRDIDVGRRGQLAGQRVLEQDVQLGSGVRSGTDQPVHHGVTDEGSGQRIGTLSHIGRGGPPDGTSRTRHRVRIGTSDDLALETVRSNCDDPDVTKRVHPASMASTSTVPTIDISGLFSCDLDERKLVAQAIGRACEDIGFLTVTGHGIHPGLIREVFGQTRRVFARPTGEKMSYAWDDDHPNRGYDPPASRRLDSRAAPDQAAPDQREAWSFSPEHVLSSPHPMQGPNRWPELAGFRTPVIRYHEAIIDLAARLLGAMALSLDLPEDAFAPYHRNPICTLRLLHHPPRSDRATDRDFGAGAHSDWGALTILAQDDVGSLEVLDRRGTWIEVPPRDDAFVVNVGDLLALWTNDRYTSTMHRVHGVTDRDRYSVACFFDLDPEARIECLPTCATPTRPPIYAPMTAGDHLLERYRASLGVASAA